MTLLLATLPDDSAQLPAWLERHLTGPNLADVVAELTAIHGDRLAPRPAIEILGTNGAAVVSRGLAALPVDELRIFLAHPRLLFELQEIILSADSPYWNRLISAPEIATAVGHVSQRLNATLGLARSAESTVAFRFKWYREPALVALATAAIVLIGVYLAQPSEWGWNKPNILAEGTTAAAHLTALANAAGEWHTRPKENSAMVAKTLREMRDGCTRLLAAEHLQLTPPDRKWLALKCVDWGKKLDQHLADLTANGKDWQEVRRDADDTVNKLIQALRTRAAAAT